MAKYYTKAFKLETVKRVERTGEPATKIAEELGINPNTIYGWLKRFREHPEGPFPGSGRLSPEDERLRQLERENRDLREEIEILKKAAVFFAENQRK